MSPSSEQNGLLADGQDYAVTLGDCIPGMHAMPPASVDFAVTSVPFPSVYAYTNEAGDIGNSEELDGEARLHFSFFFRGLRRVLKPGRAAVIHCQQIVRMKRSGYSGLYDFRGLLIRLGRRAGLVYEYDWSVRKNPQAQAIRTKSRELQFAGLESDRARSRGALQDYLVKFTCPGENGDPVNDPGQVSRNDWIQWAEGCWGDIKETDTLNVSEGRGENDTKHICPLQLGLIRRLVRLYTDPGELVYDPFTGIGSTPFCALELGRRAFGHELKPEYHAAALLNCQRAVARRRESQQTLWTPATTEHVSA